MYLFLVNRNVTDVGPDVITKFTGERIHSYRYISLRLVSRTYHLFPRGPYIGPDAGRSPGDSDFTWEGFLTERKD